ncbi:MAG: hypothetical protein ACYC7B_03390 [Burkholderiales bacterium]
MASPNPVDLSHKRALDAILLKISGVEAGEMAGLLAYFVGKKMFACICNGGVGVRLSAAEAANLQFAKDNVVPFQPKGRPSSREWIQINHDDSADYESDLAIFQASIAFVRSAKG